MSRIDALMETLIVPSFTSLGCRLRSRLLGWPDLESFSLKGKTVVLTGGTSGIGEAGAALYSKLGATLVIVARNPSKTTEAIDSLKASSGNQNITSVIADLADRDDVRRCAQTLKEAHPRIDVLAHNAGALFNDRKRVEDGTDMTVELMVSTPFLLTSELLPNLASGEQPGRVITMSSGGMYSQPLKVDGLEMPDSQYNGTRQYALAKRAQVVLNELWAERVSKDRCVFHALHPGWVNTPGITGALPGFSKVLGPIGALRTAQEGADTMVWLSAAEHPMKSSGEFWHDRDIRPTHRMNSTRESDTAERRRQLWGWCVAHTECNPFP